MLGRDVIKVKKPYSRWLDLVREKGSVPAGKINVPEFLYLRRQKELRDLINVRPVRQNVFEANLGSMAFKPFKESFKYKFYKKLNKRWSELI